MAEEKDERHGKKTKGRRRGKIRENEHGREALNKKYAKHPRPSPLTAAEKMKNLLNRRSLGNCKQPPLGQND